MKRQILKGSDPKGSDPVRIVGVGLLPLNLRMRQPFVTALGEKRISRNLLIVLKLATTIGESATLCGGLANGIAGFGEASASLAWPLDTQEAMSRCLRSFTHRLIGSEIRSYRRLINEAWEKFGEHPTAVAALECALLDAFTQSQGISLVRWLGGKKRSVVTSLTLSACGPDYASRMVHNAYAQGFRIFKIKVTGQEIDEDIRRVLAVHRAAPKATLWLDGNQGFTTQEAIRFALFMREHRLPIRLFEQPVPKEDWEGLAQVQREGKIPVAADESARTVTETARLIRRRVVSIVNIKLAKSGLLGALKIIRLAKAHGTQLMIGCMAESAIGLSPSVALACGSGAFDFVDLDSHLLVVSPPAQGGFAVKGPRLAVDPNRPGSGVIFPTPTR